MTKQEPVNTNTNVELHVFPVEEMEDGSEQTWDLLFW